MSAELKMKELLGGIKTIAIVGAKDKPGQPVDNVGRYLLRAGYRLLPVHPVRQEVWGLKTYASLGELPYGPDAVVLFRAPEYCLEHAREALELKPLPKLFWMQEGIRCPAAAELLEPHGVAVVQDLCIKTEHQRLLGGHPLAGL